MPAPDREEFARVEDKDGTFSLFINGKLDRDWNGKADLGDLEWIVDGINEAHSAAIAVAVERAREEERRKINRDWHERLKPDHEAQDKRDDEIILEAKEDCCKLMCSLCASGVPLLMDHKTLGIAHDFGPGVEVVHRYCFCRADAIHSALRHPPAGEKGEAK